MAASSACPNLPTSRRSLCACRHASELSADDVLKRRSSTAGCYSPQVLQPPHLVERQVRLRLLPIEIGRSAKAGVAATLHHRYAVLTPFPNGRFCAQLGVQREKLRSRTIPFLEGMTRYSSNMAPYPPASAPSGCLAYSPNILAAKGHALLVSCDWHVLLRCLEVIVWSAEARRDDRVRNGKRDASLDRALCTARGVPKTLVAASIVGLLSAQYSEGSESASWALRCSGNSITGLYTVTLVLLHSSASKLIV